MVAPTGEFVDNKLFFSSTFTTWSVRIAYRLYMLCGVVHSSSS